MDHERILMNLQDARASGNSRQLMRWQKVAYLNNVPGFEYVAEWKDRKHGGF